MRRVLPIVALALALWMPPPIEAQLQGVVFSAYYECDPALEAALDQVVMEAFGPIYQRHVDAGDLTSWGWTAHVLGGAWRRLATLIVPDRETGFRVRGAILQEAQAEQPAAVQLFNTVCPTHEDYIWTIAQSSQVADPNADPTPFMTTYYSCNQGEEARADEIVTETIAPVLEDLVREGHLNGWSWLVHDSGGWFRRAAVFSGSDHPSIMSARDMLVERLGDSDSVIELLTICSSHVDYNWNPVTAN